MVPIPIADLDRENANVAEYDGLRKKIYTYLNRQFKKDLAYNIAEFDSIRHNTQMKFSERAPGGILAKIVDGEAEKIVAPEQSIRGLMYTRRAMEKKDVLIKELQRGSEKMHELHKKYGAKEPKSGPKSSNWEITNISKKVVQGD